MLYIYIPVNHGNPYGIGSLRKKNKKRQVTKSRRQSGQVRLTLSLKIVINKNQTKRGGCSFTTVDGWNPAPPGMDETL